MDWRTFGSFLYFSLLSTPIAFANGYKISVVPSDWWKRPWILMAVDRGWVTVTFDLHYKFKPWKKSISLKDFYVRCHQTWCLLEKDGNFHPYVLPYLTSQETILALTANPHTLLSFSGSNFAHGIYSNKMCITCRCVDCDCRGQGYNSLRYDSKHTVQRSIVNIK